MSNPPARRIAPEPAAAPTASGLSSGTTGREGDLHALTTTVVRADLLEPMPGEPLHPQLLAQLREVRLRSGGAAAELDVLLRIISRHYDLIDAERRGSVRAMQLMADEAASLARASEAGSHKPLQVILDHIKDTVLTVDEHGSIETFNPTGERVFGVSAGEAIGRSLELLLPQIADQGSAALGLARLAQACADDGLAPAPQEIWGRRKSGEVFPAEITVGRARAASRALFVVCLREITERRATEHALRESEARYRMLVDHAPDAIVVIDGDSGRFVDANAHAERLFGSPRAALLTRGPLDLSPPQQPDGRASALFREQYLAQALAGEPQHFEWQLLDAHGRQFTAEVRLLSLPSVSQRLVRGSITDIEGRKSAERLAAAEREVLQRIVVGAPLLDVLEAITRLIESALPESIGCVSLLSADGATFANLIAPHLPHAVQLALGRSLVGIRNGSCAAAVYLRRPVAVADVTKDPIWQYPRDAALRAGIRAAWSAPVLGAERVLGSIGVYRREPGLPDERESEVLARAAQLAGIAVERLYADEARRRAEQAVLAEKERALVTLQSIGDAVISTCSRGLIDYMNPIAERLTGWTAAEARGAPLSMVVRLVEEATRAELDDPAHRLLARGEGTSTGTGASEHWVLVTRKGEEVAVQESAAPIRGAEGRVLGAVFVFRDVTKERRLKRALAYQATHDALTGLINRREFDSRLQAALASAQRGGGPYALIYIDLDQFKLVNDTCGHPAGDRLMRNITALLQTRVRSSDTLARLGGDEFGILLDSCALEQATHIAETLRQAIRGYRFVWENTAHTIGASIGVVPIERGTQSVARLMSAADIACYAAKDAGRNRVHVYTEAGGSHRDREIEWVARLTRAVEEQRLELHVQPIRRLGAVGTPAVAPSFYELTVILRDEDDRRVAPGEFLPMAERYNLMPAIDRWAVTRVRAWLARRPPGTAPLLAVPLSGSSLADASFVEYLLSQVDSPEVAAALCFQLTESAAVAHLAPALQLVRELRKRGCRFALDEFGSAVSSFTHLKSLPVDFLRIHGELVSHLGANPVDRTMVEAIGNIGRALGVATVADPVESPGTLAELTRIGIDYVQGTLIAPSRPLSELELPANATPLPLG